MLHLNGCIASSIKASGFSSRIKLRNTVNKTLTPTYPLPLNLAPELLTVPTGLAIVHSHCWKFIIYIKKLRITKLWLQNELFILKEWIPQHFKIACMNNFQSPTCCVPVSQHVLGLSFDWARQIYCNFDLILQNQHLKLLMLQGKQKEYSVKDPNQPTDSLMLRHTPQKKKKVPQTSFSVYQRNRNSWLINQTELKNWISCELLFNFCHSNGYRVSTRKKYLRYNSNGLIWKPREKT